MDTQQEFQAWAAFEPKGELKPFTYTPRPLGPQDVEIKIHYCGLSCKNFTIFILKECADQISIKSILVGVRVTILLFQVTL